MFHQGDPIGPYTLVRFLDNGNFGAAWLAKKTNSILGDQNLVVLKIASNASVNLDDIRHEAQVLLEVKNHPNVLRLIDAEIVPTAYGDQAVIVTDYVPGGSLQRWLEKQGGKVSSLEEAVSIINNILSGLEYM